MTIKITFIDGWGDKNVKNYNYIKSIEDMGTYFIIQNNKHQTVKLYKKTLNKSIKNIEIE